VKDEKMRLEGGRGFVFAGLTGRERERYGFWLINDENDSGVKEEGIWRLTVSMYLLYHPALE